MSTKENSATFTWQLIAYEQHGKLMIRWGSDAPFRPQQGRIHVYNNGFPGNPTEHTAAWCWDDQHGGVWNSGLNWGTKWHCAYIAENSPHNFRYMVKLITTKEMGPDVEKPSMQHH